MGEITSRVDENGVDVCDCGCPQFRLGFHRPLCTETHRDTGDGLPCYPAAIAAFRDHRAMEALRRGTVVRIDRSIVDGVVVYEANASVGSWTESDDPAEAIEKAGDK
jgi:hypothetical protein